MNLVCDQISILLWFWKKKWTVRRSVLRCFLMHFSALRMLLSQKKKVHNVSPTEIRTRIAGFTAQSVIHYTIGSYIIRLLLVFWLVMRGVYRCLLVLLSESRARQETNWRRILECYWVARQETHWRRNPRVLLGLTSISVVPFDAWKFTDSTQHKPISGKYRPRIEYRIFAGDSPLRVITYNNSLATEKRRPELRFWTFLTPPFAKVGWRENG